MAKMIVCGLSMEMEMAKEMGYVGKCIGCLHNLIYIDGDRRELLCEKKGIVKEKTNCKEWVVDHR